MALEFMKTRKSNTRGPDYSAKRDTEAILSGQKKTPSEADYKPATADAKQRCHECKSYSKFGEPESDCKKVVGIVKAEGICDLFSQRDYSDTKEAGVVISIGVGK